MKNRVYYLSHSFFSLCVGLSLYLFVRQGTYIHQILHTPIAFGFSEVSFFGDKIVRYAFPDFLWGYALSMVLYALWLPRKKAYIISVISALLGIAWELCQLLSIVNGTFDIIDCGMYILASIISYHFYKKREKLK